MPKLRLAINCVERTNFAGPDVSDLFSEAATGVEERLVPCGWLCTEDHPPLPSKNKKKTREEGMGEEAPGLLASARTIETVSIPSPW